MSIKEWAEEAHEKTEADNAEYRENKVNPEIRAKIRKEFELLGFDLSAAQVIEDGPRLVVDGVTFTIGSYHGLAICTVCPACGEDVVTMPIHDADGLYRELTDPVFDDHYCKRNRETNLSEQLVDILRQLLNE